MLSLRKALSSESTIFSPVFLKKCKKSRIENASVIKATMVNNFVPTRELGSDEAAACRLRGSYGWEIVSLDIMTTEWIAQSLGHLRISTAISVASRPRTVEDVSYLR